MDLCVIDVNILVYLMCFHFSDIATSILIKYVMDTGLTRGQMRRYAARQWCLAGGGFRVALVPYSHTRTPHESL